MNEQQCIAFWEHVTQTIDQFATLNHAEMGFGVAPPKGRYGYDRLPVVTNRELVDFEKRNGIKLPLEYRTFLQIFGAGGAGPFYGIYDFRKYIMGADFRKPFPFNEIFSYEGEVPDHHPIWDLEGLGFISTEGCGTDYYIELNGPKPGRIWCDWMEACQPMGDFLELYQNWFQGIEKGLSVSRR